MQADCYAGLWINSIIDDDVLGVGEIYEAIDAAEAVGDDRIQESINGEVDQESWAHGSSEDRKYWLNVGYESGEVNSCNTI